MSTWMALLKMNKDIYACYKLGTKSNASVWSIQKQQHNA